MNKPFSVLSRSALVVLFACSVTPAFAQRGGGGFHGGGGGGGFHGGGGGGMRSGGGGGGGMRSGGGGGPRGGSYSPPAAGYSGPRTSAAPPMRSGGGFATRPGNNYAPPGTNFAGGNRQPGNSSSGPPPAVRGQWHTFGPAGNNGPSSAQTAPPSNPGSFHVFNGNRATVSPSSGAVRSFSGQGHDVWENPSAARNVVPKSQSLATLQNSFRGSAAASSGSRANPALSTSARIRMGATLPGSPGTSSVMNQRNSVQQLRGGFDFDGFNRFGRGCWNCGFGFGGWGWGSGWGLGLGWGWGWPGLGLWGWDPFWVDPWWGWSAPGYGYGVYPSTNNYYNYYGYPDSGTSAPYDNSTPPAQQEFQNDQGNSDNSNSSNGNWVTPNGPSPSSAPSSGGLAVPVLIYMKDGSVRSVRDYWMVDGDLHYILMNGVQSFVDLEQVDLPRTNTENAKSGVKFIFKSEPGISAPAQPDGEPASPREPSPTQQIDAMPQPEART